ncbi:YbhB/YbcL family Raf kinase inhibitor-like protein [Pseudoduganella armeniaca]|uniref:YbhB/YbcL family Raf kinase inhibitor-like protein n=1 Tax=Pseudoduganella armeniaca TaxID=2072590 RepID=A0A2R4CB76_9BURK|nr:YbhB/YbcL family Raf kinase inhibitor-like protein [Pseudoduganella armeniaca]AVR96879.1 YbhB/YbcL family Raf kinase inhibitor-like protein [Pseudoduganella armeniaca]
MTPSQALPAVLALLACAAVHAQQGDGTRVAIATAIWKPAKVEATPERIAALKAPPGFSVAPFATGLKNARIIAVAPNGDIYVSRRDQGDVLLLRDRDGDGKADGAPVPVASRAGAHGLAIRDGKLYLATVKEVFVAEIASDGRLGPLKLILGDLPDAGQHPNRTLAFGPDGMLYISAGSTCNTCNESNPENATLLRATPDGKQRTIFATGLRNTIGFDWQPRTGELWGFDHGIDFLGDDSQQEELNKLELGKQYGWPHVHGAGEIYPQSTPVGEITKEQWRARSTAMVLGYTAHAAPMQLVFYRHGMFPAEYDGDAFVTMRGSWNRSSASGYEIVRVRFVDGQPRAIEPFVTGFLTDGARTHIARPVGLAVARDGALLMADDANGVLYRIAYTGTAARPPGAPAPAGPMRTQAEQGSGVALAHQRLAVPGRMTVVSSAFDANGMLDARYSEYADGVSPPLSWQSVPGARSYAVIMEDPDARPYRPFVHWLAWNIPAAVTALPEGVQEQPRLTEPAGVLQGRNTRGSTGYYGPRPPVGDAAHRYHFQVFALDTMLELPFGADREQLVAALQGHVLARGAVVGRYAQKVKPPK